MHDDPQKRKRNFARRRRITLTFLTLLFLTALSAGLYYLWTAEQLKFEHLKLTPLTFAQPKQVLTLCVKHRDQNLIGLLLNFKLKQAILALHPAIQTVSFSLEWPQTFVVHVQERQPSMAFLSPHQVLLVSSDGVVLFKGSALSPQWASANLMTVTGIHPRFLKGPRIHANIVDRIHALIPMVQTLPQPITVHYKRLFLGDRTDFDQIELVLGTSSTLKIGNGIQLNDQLERFNRFWQYWTTASQNRTIKTIDLRVPGKVIVSYGS